jgi:hypothetical protein
LFDNFKLEYLGGITLSDQALALTYRIVEANSLLTLRMQQTAIDALNAAITQAQQAATAQPLVEADVNTAKNSLDLALSTANTSIQAYAKLLKTINHAKTILGFLDKETEIVTLQNAIDVANGHYNNLACWQGDAVMAIVVADNSGFLPVFQLDGCSWQRQVFIIQDTPGEHSLGCDLGCRWQPLEYNDIVVNVIGEAGWL